MYATIVHVYTGCTIKVVVVAVVILIEIDGLEVIGTTATA